jgi:hypothetical protein
MSDLRERFQEVADAAAREGRTPGAAAAIRRARQRQRRLAGGVASLLVVLVLAGTIIVDRMAGGLDEPTPLPAVGPPGAQSLPGTAVRTDQPAAGTPEHQLLRHMTAVLNDCPGGGTPELIGWVRAHGFTLLVASKPPQPGEDWLCQVGGYPHPGGSVNAMAERWIHEELPPPSRKRLAATGGNLDIPADRGTLAYVQGYATRQAARVRLLAKDGSPRLELGLVDPGDRYPVKFFIALFTVPTSSDFPFATVEALDQGGRTIARCTAGAPPVGDCRDV